MKKKIYTIILVAFLVSSTYAQENVFKNGDQVINIGIGFGSNLYANSYFSTSVPPISISYEKGIKDGVLDKGILSVGGYLGYSSFSESFPGTNYGFKYSDIIIGVRGNIHYPIVDKLDTYAGLMLGFEILSSSVVNGDSYLGGGYSASSGGLRLDLHVGARYYLSDKIAIMGELGYGIAYLNLGIGIKI